MTATDARESILLGALKTRHWKKLSNLVAEAKSGVSMYSRLYADLSIEDIGVGGPALLERLPLLEKSDLLAVPIEERTNQNVRAKDPAIESTTGSTGQPFGLTTDSHYRRRRNRRFLCGLIAAGYRPWQRLMLLSDRHTRETRALPHRFYVPVEQPTSGILEAYERIRPHVLYGFLTPLRLLAGQLARTPSCRHRPALVISTAEMLDSQSRDGLESACSCPVADFYGLTEMGLVAWQRPGADGYIVSNSGIIAELVPEPSVHDRYRLVMTNLDLRVSPMIRFDTGDLVSVRRDGEALGIRAIEGRRIDAIVLSDGNELSPYRVTDALRDVSGVRRFRIVQQQNLAVDVEFESSPSDRQRIGTEISSLMGRLLGDNIELDVRFTDEILSDGLRKFRPIESRVSGR